MNRKREAVFMGIGILTGLALSGPAVHAADYLKATISNQPIYVDSQRVSMTAYNIGGNNYVRLRDIGRAVDFGVTYDAATNSVHIDSTQPYREEHPTAPSSPAEESVQASLAALRERYHPESVLGRAVPPLVAGAAARPRSLHALSGIEGLKHRRTVLRACGAPSVSFFREPGKDQKFCS